MEWLQDGSRGERVRELQAKLQAKGFNPGGVDGVFGPKTGAAVRRYQEQHGLQVDGIAGPETCGHLGMEGFEQPTEAAAAPEPARTEEVRSKVISPKTEGTDTISSLADKAEEAEAEAEEQKAAAVDAMSGAMLKAEEKVDEVAADAPKGFREKIKAMREARRERKGR